jgi:hypothetical protein
MKSQARSPQKAEQTKLRTLRIEAAITRLSSNKEYLRKTTTGIITTTMDTTTYASLGALYASIAQDKRHAAAPEPEFAPLDLSFIKGYCSLSPGTDGGSS